MDSQEKARLIWQTKKWFGNLRFSCGATRWMADWMSEKELAAMKTMSVGDWNTNDPWQRSRINFEGYVTFNGNLAEDHHVDTYLLVASAW
jgi:hypothetical protein